MRLTAREREILEVLRKDPLISQEDLAGRLRISRSSAAVHISNLMKKGAVLGKGYVFSEQASIAVIGDTFLGIEVDETEPRIEIYHSGTALSLSTIFAELGIRPKVMTVLGNDDLATEILGRMQQLNIDTSSIVRLNKRRTCRRIYTQKELIYEESIAEAEIQKAFESWAWAALNCEYLVVDPHYQTMIYQLFNNKEEDSIPQLCTYGYLADDQDISEATTHYHIVVLGVQDPLAWDRCISRCLELAKDDHLLVITDGSNHLVFIKDAQVYDFPLLPGQTFDWRTGIPRLLAGLVYGLSNRYPTRQAVRIGVGAASSN